MPREDDKLVRDEIPEIIRNSGETPVTHVADDEELDRRLAEKVVEEAREFEESHQIEELVDIVAVIDAILAREAMNWGALRELISEKETERGGFKDGIVLECVDKRTLSNSYRCPSKLWFLST